MKKLIAAVLVASFGMGVFAADTYLVYDYKASIKRLDAKLTYKKNTPAESYAVASDTLTGYLQVPVCQDCEGDATTLLGADATLYVTRKGDKYNKEMGNDFVFKCPALVNAAVFGAKLNTLDTTNLAPQDSAKDANKAWMALDYLMPDATQVQYVDSTLINKKLGNESLNYGPLGVTNVDGGEVLATGFGSAKVLAEDDVTTTSWCGSSTDPGYTCIYVNTISGSVIGTPSYMGVCDLTPMWDVCSLDIVADAVISGTWTLKYNKTATGAGDKDSQEAYILDKFKATAADVLEANDDSMVWDTFPF